METESRQEKPEKFCKFWKTHLDKWEASGLPQKEYCRQHNLIYHRFGYWKGEVYKLFTVIDIEKTLGSDSEK